ncbi:hypothetical protein [Actinomadura decatromicini]|uniref:Uncharacterized protein n=1 Tax=Actinomadura decatromicini TaxID=2604572 RepID=A0A5D3FUP4_9ACTN|nr:hypothetical protein [Actinomadura decatromicini]TYK52587.1 hypothetical protein FXF68_02105 [Actinomadura decatromicini]
MDIKWGPLGQVFVVALGATVAVVVIFTLGLLAASARQDAGERARSTTIPTATAALCFSACAAIVVYGIYLIVPQFH